MTKRRVMKGDTVSVETRCTRADRDSFPIRIGEVLVTLSQGHPSVVSVWTALAKRGESEEPIAGVHSDDRERDRRRWR